MKKEDHQSSQEGSGGAENKARGLQQEKHSTTQVTEQQQKDTARQAGVGTRPYDQHRG